MIEPIRRGLVAPGDRRNNHEAMPEGANSPSSSVPAVANEPEQARPTGRGWIIAGIVITLIGIVMGYIMSSVGS